MKFAVDASLGSLAKWLRLLGFEVQLWRRSLPPPQAGTFILRRAPLPTCREARSDIIHLRAADLEGQLEELRQQLPALGREAAPGSRCSRCNSFLQPCPASEVEDLVPDYIRHRFQEFFLCPHCRKVYWPGSHFQRFRRRLDRWTGTGNQQE